MIRINLLGAEAGPRGLVGTESHWISRRELWLGIVLLGAGMAVLFYMATRMPRPSSPAQQRRVAPPPPAGPSQAPAAGAGNVGLPQHAAGPQGSTPAVGSQGPALPQAAG